MGEHHVDVVLIRPAAGDNQPPAGFRLDPLPMRPVFIIFPWSCSFPPCDAARLAALRLQACSLAGFRRCPAIRAGGTALPASCPAALAARTPGLPSCRDVDLPLALFTSPPPGTVDSPVDYHGGPLGGRRQPSPARPAGAAIEARPRPPTPAHHKWRAPLRPPSVRREPAQPGGALGHFWARPSAPYATPPGRAASASAASGSALGACLRDRLPYRHYWWDLLACSGALVHLISWTKGNGSDLASDSTRTRRGEATRQHGPSLWNGEDTQ